MVPLGAIAILMKKIGNEHNHHLTRKDENRLICARSRDMSPLGAVTIPMKIKMIDTMTGMRKLGPSLAIIFAPPKTAAPSKAVMMHP